ncbi:helix-hairpin-helix domain-containing protein [Streptococcus merionis]|uniref:helix-hairpin-helix domain-containing protein n=1 Tax=Streptococcus merionis TaxID=400065 RepID=UPI0026E944F4|nr:helix-hairpin-helix domain-containing protein [Streptococcus merionis]
MAKKKVNRKKQLRKQMADLRRASQEVVNRAVKSVQETADNVVESAEQVVETVAKNVQEVAGAVVDKVEEAKEAKAAKSLEVFIADFDGVPAARLETFYAAGITSREAFADWTEEALLELSGIGPATLKKLKEAGVVFKG